MVIISVKIEVKESDFCITDLEEVLNDGFNNVGNHTFLNRHIGN